MEEAIKCKMHDIVLKHGIKHYIISDEDLIDFICYSATNKTEMMYVNLIDKCLKDKSLFNDKNITDTIFAIEDCIPYIDEDNYRSLEQLPKSRIIKNILKIKKCSVESIDTNVIISEIMDKTDAKEFKRLLSKVETKLAEYKK